MIDKIIVLVYSLHITAGVMSALRNLQQRLKQIEREKQQAEFSLNSLKYDGGNMTQDYNHNKTSMNLSNGDSTVASGEIHQYFKLV